MMRGGFVRCRRDSAARAIAIAARAVLLLIGMMLALGALTSAARAQTAPTVEISFSPTSVARGAVSIMSVKTTNPNNATMTNIAATTAFPAGLTMVGVSEERCGYSIVGSAPGASLRVSSLGLAAGSSCTVRFRVVGSEIGIHSITPGDLSPPSGTVAGTRVTGAIGAPSSLGVENTPLVASLLQANASMYLKSAYRFTPVGSTGGVGTLRYALTGGALPSGLSFSTTTGEISGIPTTTLPSTTFTVTVTDQSEPMQSSSKSFTLDVQASILQLYVAQSHAALKVGTAVSLVPVTASGGTGAFTFAILGTLPAGLSLSPATGELSGTPTAPSPVADYTVRVTDEGNPAQTKSATFAMRVDSTTPIPPAIEATLSPATVQRGTNVVLAIRLRSANATMLRNITSITSLPPGLSVVSLIGEESCGFRVVKSGQNVELRTTDGAAECTVRYSLRTEADGVQTITPGDVLAPRGEANGSIHIGVAGAPASVTVENKALDTILREPQVFVRLKGTYDIAPVTSVGGNGTLSYALSGGTLPNGLTFSTTTGRISGSPLAALATTTFTITVSDQSNPARTSSKSFSLTSAPADLSVMAIKTDYRFELNQVVDFLTVTAQGGTGTFSYALAAGTLPAGLSFSTTTGAISGAPTTSLVPTTFAVTVRDQGDPAQVKTVTFTMRVNPAVPDPPTIEASFTPNSIDRGGSATLQIRISGLDPNMRDHASATAIPAGLTIISQQGEERCGFTVVGAAPNQIIEMVRGYNCTARYAVRANVAGTFVITPGDVVAPRGTVAGVTYVGVPGSPATLTSMASTLTALVVDSSADMTLNSTYRFVAVVARGGTGTLSYALSGRLPAGLSFDTTTGEISGTPVEVLQPTSFTVTISDQSNPVKTASGTFSLSALPATLGLTVPVSQIALTLNQATAFIPAVAKGGLAPLTYTLRAMGSRQLPAGLVFSTTTGEISGTPTTTLPPTVFLVAVSDRSTPVQHANRDFTLTVTSAAPIGPKFEASLTRATIPLNDTTQMALTMLNPNAVTMTNISSVTAIPPGLILTRVGAENCSFRTQGSAPNIAIAVTDGALAAGLTCTVGYRLQPTMPGTYVITPGRAGTPKGVVGGMEYTGAAGESVTLVVEAAPLVTTQAVPAPAITVGAAASLTPVTASGGTGTLSFTLTGGTLPAGLGFSSATGQITGTPTATMPPTAFTVTVTDQGIPVQSSFKTFTLSVIDPAPVVRPINLTTLQGKPVSADLAAGATGGPFTNAALVSVLPSTAGTATIIASGQSYMLTFSPSSTYAGTATLTYTLSNAAGPSAPGIVNITIAERPNPATDPSVIGTINAQVEDAQRFGAQQLDNFNRHLRTLHGGGRLKSGSDVSINFDSLITRDDRDPLASSAPFAAGDNEFGVLRANMKERARQRDWAPDWGTRFAEISTENIPMAGKDDGDELKAAGLVTGSNFAWWTAGSIDLGDLASVGDTPRLRISTTGISGGFDARLSESVVVGAGSGFSFGTTDVGADGTRVKSQNYMAALYASYHPANQAFIDGVVAVGFLSYDARRFAGASGNMVRSNRSGRQVFASVTAGWDFTQGDLHLSPYGRIDWLAGTLDPTVETGDPTFALRYARHRLRAFNVEMGGQFEYVVALDGIALVPRVTVEYQRRLASSSVAGVSYADWIDSPLYTLRLQGHANDRFVFTPGFMLRGKVYAVGIDYSTSVANGRDRDQRVRGELRLAF